MTGLGSNRVRDGDGEIPTAGCDEEDHVGGRVGSGRNDTEKEEQNGREDREHGG